LPEDAVRQEVNRALNENMWAQKERKQAQSAAHQAVKEQGEDTPTKSESSYEEEEEGEITPPPLSLLRITPPPFSDIIGR
jgi:hypothetical protein